MSETESGGARQKPGTPGGKTLTLRRTETSTVKQSFSHGRTKAVVVEKKRAPVKASAKPAEIEKPSRPSAETAFSGGTAKETTAKQPLRTGGMVLRELTDDERKARAVAVNDAIAAEQERRKRAEEEAAKRAVEDDKVRKEREAAEKRKAEEEARKATEEEARKRAEQEAQAEIAIEVVLEQSHRVHLGSFASGR
jgi:translation initiation factor IF-2